MNNKDLYSVMHKIINCYHIYHINPITYNCIMNTDSKSRSFPLSAHYSFVDPATVETSQHSEISGEWFLIKELQNLPND